MGVVNLGRPLKMAAELHPRSGKLVGLSNSNRTARRNQPVQEFNHGLVLSKEPLRDRDVFTVRIDKKVNKRGPAAAASPERLQRTLSPGVRLPLPAARGFCCPGGLLTQRDSGRSLRLDVNVFIIGAFAGARGLKHLPESRCRFVQVSDNPPGLASVPTVSRAADRLASETGWSGPDFLEGATKSCSFLWMAGAQSGGVRSVL